MSQDDELERLKARRLAEMQKNLSTKEAEAAPKGGKRTPRDVLVSKLGYRGLEALELAEAQFPAQTRAVTAKLAELILYGEVNQAIEAPGPLPVSRAARAGEHDHQRKAGRKAGLARREAEQAGELVSCVPSTS